MLKNKGMTSFCCYAFIMSSTTFNYEPLKTSQPWLAVTPARGVGGGGGILGIHGGGMPPGSPNSDPTLDQILVGTLSSNDADDNENVKKTIGLISKKQLCTCITLFRTFLSRFCTTTTWKCLILRFMEDVNKQRPNFISLSELEYGSLKFSFRRVRLQLTK